MGSAGKLSVRFTIRVPHAARRDRHTPRYISPSTESIAISIATSPGGATAAKLSANLTPTSGGCSKSKGATVCQKSVALAPGTYTATVSTYDKQNESGNILSEGQSLPIKILTGKSNDISLVLGGVPHSVVVTALAPGIQGVQATGFTLLGSHALPFTITAADADNDTIVGTSSLSYKASITSGSAWKVQAAPAPKAPNAFDLTPPGTDGSTATVKIAFSNSAAACAQPGAACTVTFDAENHIQILAITDCEISCGGSAADGVQLYASAGPGFASASSSSSGYAPFATIHTGIVNPIAVAIDKAGTLFVSDCRVSCGVGSGADRVMVYQPPFTNASTPSATITTGVTYPTLLAFNSSGDLIVDNCNSCSDFSSSGTAYTFNDTVNVYSHSNYTAAPTTVASTGFVVAGLTVDANDNLLVAACQTSCSDAGADAILQYATPYNGSANAVTNGVSLTGVHTGGLASQFAFDGLGNLWSLNCGNCSGVSPSYSAVRYASPLSGASSPNLTVSSGVDFPRAVAIDQNGNLFVAGGPAASSNSDYVSEYAAPSFSGSGAKLFGGAAYQANEMTFDGFDDLVMSDGSSIQVSAPPYATMVPVAVYASPNGGQAFALSP